MELTTNTDKTISNPGAIQISEELTALTDRSDSFAILSLDGMTYIQAAGDASDPLHIEYQDGSIDKHHQSVRRVSLELAIRMFQLYSDRDSTWRDLVEWKPLDVSSSSERTGCFATLVIVFMSAGSLCWWLVARLQG